VGLYKRKDSNVWQYDFAVRGKRYRGSTGETKRSAAAEKTAKLLAEIADGRQQVGRKPQTLANFSDRFLAFIANAKLAEKSRQYLRSGWRLLQNTPVTGMRMNLIGIEEINALRFPGGPYNANCALKTLRRMLKLAQSWELIPKVPKIKLEREPERDLLLNEEAEKKLLPFCSPLLRDIIILVRDTGMRPRKELFRMRVEHLDWNNRVIFVPDSKTPDGRRFIPMSDRVLDLLLVRSAGRHEGWVFPTKRGKEKRLVTIDKQFRKARRAAGLPEKLVMYCGRHDFGTAMLQRTGNLALVMKVMGQRSTKAAMKYQHPEIEHIRTALNMARSTPGDERHPN
jgi:integrase